MVASKRFFQYILTQWIKLFQANDSHVIQFVFSAIGFEFEIYLPTAKQNAPDLVTRRGERIRQDSLKTSLGTVFKRGNDFGMTQQALGSHHNERFAPGTQRLATQAVKVLGGSCRIDDLQVVLRGEHQEAFEPGTGVLRTLAFEAMRQQQHKAAKALPLFLRTGDELIDDWLGSVRLRRGDC